MDICIICTDSINTIDTIITKCNHKFHFECINKWLVIKPQCLYCRKDIHDLIHPRTNEKKFYYYNNNEDYIQGEQHIVVPRIPIIVYNYSFILMYLLIFSYIYVCKILINQNVFTILLLLWFILFRF